MGKKRAYQPGYEKKFNKNNKPYWSKISSAKELPDIQAYDSDYWDCPTVPAHIEIPHGSQKVVDCLQNMSDPLIVGGFVRDHVMKQSGYPMSTSKDVDIEVHGGVTLNQIEKALRKRGFHVDSVGKSFGVLKVVSDGEDVDVSVPRRDSVADTTGGRGRNIVADIDPTLDIWDASRRRDLTINAISYDHGRGVILDPYDGLQDIEDGVLHIVDPETFVEDPLRALRLVQFSARFDMQPSGETLEICQNMDGSDLSEHRMREEMTKWVRKSVNIHRGVETLHDIGWDDVIPGFVKNENNPVDQDLINKLNNYSGDASYAAVVAVLDHHYGNGSGQLGQSMYLTKVQRRLFRSLPLSQGDDVIQRSRMCRTLHDNGMDYHDVDTMCQAVGIQPAQHVWEGSPPAYVKPAQYLMDKGLQPSPLFAQVDKEVKNIQDSGGVINDKVLDDLIQKYF